MLSWMKRRAVEGGLAQGRGGIVGFGGLVLADASSEVRVGWWPGCEMQNSE
jgi:hypothetical protein